MSIKSKLVFGIMVCFSFIFMSNRQGRAFITGTGATTAPGETGQYCGSIGCHFSGSFDPLTSIELIDENDQPADKYIPGAEYTIRLNADVIGFPAGYGFQIVALNGNDNSGTNGFSNFPNNVRQVMVGDRQYVEHSNRLPALPIELNWTAPEEGSGNIDFYAVINAVNGNGSTSGDGADTASVTIVEDIMSSTFNNDNELNMLKIWPNPASDIIYLDSSEKIINLRLVNNMGQSVLNTSSIYNGRIDISHLENGLYFAVVQFDIERKETYKILINR